MATTNYASIIEQIADPDVPLAKFRGLVKLEPSRSKPFTPSIGLDFGHAALARTADPFTPTAGAVGDAFIQRRQEQYRRKMAAGDTSLRFVAEGDSWFHYPIVLRDTLDWLSDDYAIFDLAAAGDTLENMKRGISNIIDVIQRENSQGFLLSGGGNDILEANRLTLLLRPYTPDPSGGPLYKTAQDYIIMHRLDAYLTQIIADYRDFFDVLTGKFADLKIFCHGYDWMLPRFDGIYLWPVMEEREIQEPLRASIIKIMVDQFNARLQQLAGDATYGGRVIYVNCRGAVGNKSKWFDEVHPRTPGFGRVAGRFKSAINAVFGMA
jgi:hypothetical protein